MSKQECHKLRWNQNKKQTKQGLVTLGIFGGAVLFILLGMAILKRSKVGGIFILLGVLAFVGLAVYSFIARASLAIDTVEYADKGCLEYAFDPAFRRRFVLPNAEYVPLN